MKVNTLHPDILADGCGDPCGWFVSGHVDKRKFKGACISLFRTSFPGDVPDVPEADFWRAKVEHVWIKEEPDESGVFEYVWNVVPEGTPEAEPMTVLNLTGYGIGADKSDPTRKGDPA